MIPDAPMQPIERGISIRHKIVAIASVIVLAVTVFIVVYVPAELEKQAIVSVTDKAESVGRMLAFSLTAAVLFDDDDIIESRFSEALLNDDIEYLVLEAAGELKRAYRFDGALEFGYKADVGLVESEELSDLYRVAEPIVSGGERIGTLYLGLSLARVEASIEQTRRNILIVGLVLLLLGVTASYVLGRVVTRPLSLVTQAATTIAEGDLSGRVNTSSRDEVGVLAHAFNQMAEQVEGHTRELEVEVAERRRAEATLTVQHRRERIVAELASKAVQAGDLSSLLQLASDRLASSLPIHGCEIFTSLPRMDEFMLRAASGPGAPEVGVLRLNASGPDGPRRALDVNASVEVRDIGTRDVMGLDRYRLEGARLLFAEAIPAPDGIFGYVLVYSRDPDGMAKDAGRFLEIVATHLGEAAERHRAQEALREVEARQRALIQAIPDTMVRVDRTGAILDVRQPFDSPLALPDRGNLRAALPKPAMGLAQLVNDAVSSEQAQEFHFRLPVDGKKLHFEARVYPGAMKEALLLLRDVTERRELEAQVHHGEKLKSLGVLAGGIAHDFNNLLMGINFNAGMLEMELPADTPLRQYVDEITSTGTRLAELTNQMLAYSGQGRFVIDAVDLNQLVRETERLLEVSVSKKITVATDLDEDLPATLADIAQVRQVVLNLMINASDAIGTDVGTIEVRTESLTLGAPRTPTLPPGPPLEPGDYVRLSVKDSGVGMTHETISKIFEPFFTTKAQGRGLGLGAVLGIVRSHNGMIEVESSPGSGTEFIVWFPKGEEQAARENRVAPSTAGGRSADGASVLVVDDEELVRVSAGRLLGRMGFGVLEGRDGPDGLETFLDNQHAIDLVILDMTMPGMSGDEVLVEIRRHSPHVPVLISSGFSESAAIDRLENDPHVDFIQKPYRPLELKAKVESMRGPVPSTLSAD